MSLWKIAWRSIQQRSLASLLTAISMALGVMLVVAVLVINSVVQLAFGRGGGSCDLIVGPPKGSNLELVLNNIFYVGQSQAKLSYSVYRDLNESRISKDVRVAVPICLGDTYKDKRVVGTTPGMFDDLTYFGDHKYEFAQGHNFEENAFFDAVAGAAAARQTGLKLGDSFKPTHGVVEKSEHKHGDFTVVGILKPTGTPNDNALFVNIEGFYRVGGHTGKTENKPAAKADEKPESKPESKPDWKTEKKPATKSEAKTAEKPEEHHDEHDEVIPDSRKEVSAVLVCLYPDKEASQTLPLKNEINKRPDAQAAVPSVEISNLFKDIIGNIEVVLLVFGVMIVLVAGIGIMVSIYNSMNDRRHEIAIMRALGAQRSTVMIVILLESILLSLGGGLLGLAMGHGLLTIAGPWIAEQVNLPLSMLHFDRVELWLIPGLIGLASIVGYLPAVAAYRTDVGKSLIANP